MCYTFIGLIMTHRDRDVRHIENKALVINKPQLCFMAFLFIDNDFCSLSMIYFAAGNTED